jgi:TRAP-type C4-dicarboxylate transport system substrate-binding protein
MEAAREVSQKATQMTLDLESDNLAKIKATGMTVIGEAEGLDREAFRKRTSNIVSQRFGAKYGDLYRDIAAMK